MTAALPIFLTITSADWVRSIRIARATPNQIRARLASRFPRQVTAQSESRTEVFSPATARRSDAFISSSAQNRWNSPAESARREAAGECAGEELSFTSAGSAARIGDGTPGAEAGGGDSLSEGGHAARPCPDLVETRPLTATPRPTWGAQNFMNSQNIT